MAKKKYKPKEGDLIEFYHEKSKETGTIEWIGHTALTVYPHTVKITDRDKKPIDTAWWREYSDLIGKVEE